ncbi:hypothetical protein N8674_02255 [Akkermansiaceae bacterium]|nr:hypothetical protein [Akkermansiaceae bacterium]MDB4764541.1 hypothetical protein [Akkermansiaceae bacterium]
MIRLIDERVMEKLRDKPENIDLEEFLPLVGEWREDNASKAKCPYCVEPIQKQATKCNHCLSEIEWFKFDGLYGPCEAGASEEMEAALVMAKATLHGAIQAKKAAEKAEQEAKFQKRITQLQSANCISCQGPVLTSDEQKKVEAKPHTVSVLEHKYIWGNGYRCYACKAVADKSFGWWMLIIALSFFIFMIWAANR